MSTNFVHDSELDYYQIYIYVKQDSTQKKVANNRSTKLTPKFIKHCNFFYVMPK